MVYILKEDTEYVSVYIRGETDWCLVKVYNSGFDSSRVLHYLAIDEAIEQGCLPGGHRLIMDVLEQDQSLYNKLFSKEATDELTGVVVR